MGQIERGANRIYGIQRDRPALKKYGRAVLMALTAGLMSVVGLLIIVAGGTLGDVLANVYGWQDFGLHVWQALRFPVGILLAFGSFAIIVEKAPRRRQPGWSWVGIGAGVSLVLWILFTYALSLYVAHSGSFGSTYGPLTGVMALLLWAYLTSIALFLGIAFCAQLEAVRAGVREPTAGDPEEGRAEAVAREGSARWPAARERHRPRMLTRAHLAAGCGIMQLPVPRRPGRAGLSAAGADPAEPRGGVPVDRVLVGGVAGCASAASPRSARG